MQTNVSIAQFNRSTQCQTYHVRMTQLFEAENLDDTSVSPEKRRERKVY